MVPGHTIRGCLTKLRCVSLAQKALPVLRPARLQLQSNFLLSSSRQLSSAPRRTSRVVASAGHGSQAVLPASFSEIGLGDELVAALSAYNIEKPTEVQALAIPAILRGGDVMLASHTGSGKTLAYLLPLVKLLKEQEIATGTKARPKRPRALILGPTRELTDQILSVAKSLSHFAKFRSVCVNGGGNFTQQEAALDTPLDILVGTPQRVALHAEKGNIFYGDVQFLVLDEADTLFDRGFGPELAAVMKPLRRKERPARTLLASATMTKSVRRLIEEELPGLVRVETSTLHRGVQGAKHSFMQVPPGSSKLDMLMQVVQSEVTRGRRVMVFCNTLDSCRATEHHLTERGLPTLCYHGDVPIEERRAAMAQFSAGVPEGGKQALLICTDLAARGLDMSAPVDHVVNFDFPGNPIDYLHRTGRTARAGLSGRITSLVWAKERVLAQRVEEALQRGQPLDGLSSVKSVVPPYMRPTEATKKRQLAVKKAAQHARKGLRGASRAAAMKEGRDAQRGPLAKGKSKPAAKAGSSKAASSGGPKASYAGAARGAQAGLGGGGRSKVAAGPPRKFKVIGGRKAGSFKK